MELIELPFMNHFQPITGSHHKAIASTSVQVEVNGILTKRDHMTLHGLS